MNDPTQYENPTAVHARIEISLEMQEMSVGGAILDAKGVASAIRDYLASLPVCKGQQDNEPQIKVTEVAVATKDWEFAAQLRFADEWSRPNG